MFCGRTVVFTAMLTAVAVFASGCGGSTMTLPEFAAEGDHLLDQLWVRLDAAEAEMVATSPTPSNTAIYLSQRTEARQMFLDGVRALHPPKEVAALYEQTVDILSREISAEEALTRRAEAARSVGEIWASGEAATFAQIDEEAVQLCRSAQAQFDATADRAELGGAGWIPEDMKDVIVVDLGCPGSEQTGRAVGEEDPIRPGPAR